MEAEKVVDTVGTVGFIALFIALSYFCGLSVSAQPPGTTKPRPPADVVGNFRAADVQNQAKDVIYDIRRSE